MSNTLSLANMKAVLSFLDEESPFLDRYSVSHSQKRAIFDNLFSDFFGTFLLVKLLDRTRLGPLHVKHDRSNLCEGPSLSF